MIIQSRGVYKVKDADLRLHPDPDGRTIKPNKSRFFVVLSSATVCSAKEYEYVVGCPTSTDNSWNSDFDLTLAKGVGNLPSQCWLRIPLIQPIDKDVLRRGDFCGRIIGDQQLKINSYLADYLGLFGL